MVGVGDILRSMRKPCEDAIQAAERLAKERGALIKTVCEEGKTYERIVDLAEAENCELIILGRRGLRRFEKAFMGSATARVIGYSDRDVMVVPRKTAIGWQRILVATDGSRFSKTAVERAIDFAKSYGGELRVVSIVDVPPEFYAEAPNAVEDMIGKAKGYVKERVLSCPYCESLKLSALTARMWYSNFAGRPEA